MTATIGEVADHANVSVATVDRVLHGRSGVSAKTRQKVTEAIQTLGFGMLPSHLVESVRVRLKFLFLLPSINSHFVSEIENSIYASRKSASNIKLDIEIRRVNLTTESDIISELDELKAEDYQGIGLFAFDAPNIRDAIDRISTNGVPVVTLVSDVPSSSRLSYIGIDNLTAGRTVARLMGKFLRGISGDIGMITGNINMGDHKQRHAGFSQVLTQSFPNLNLLEPVEGDCVGDRNRTIVTNMLTSHSNLVGIYSSGAGNSGVIEALRKVGSETAPVVIMHDAINAHNAMKDGFVDAIVVQNTDQIARGAITCLVAICMDESITPTDTKIGINIYLEDNVPS